MIDLPDFPQQYVKEFMDIAKPSLMHSCTWLGHEFKKSRHWQSMKKEKKCVSCGLWKRDIPEQIPSDPTKTITFRKIHSI